MQNIQILKEHSIALKPVNDKFFFIHCLLASLHGILFLGFVCYQFIQPLFLNSELYIIGYFLLFLSFSIDFLYFYFHDQIKEKYFFHWLFLFVDAILMTVCLSVITSALYPVLIFVYMLQIFSAGLLAQYKGAFTQGLLVSFLFSWVLILNPTGMDSIQSPVLSFLMNNLGFMVVAGLSGFFGRTADKMEWSLTAVDTVMHQLENLNELIVENINMGLFILDEEAFVIHSNRNASNILGLPASFSASLYTIFPELKEHTLSREDSEVNPLQIEYQNDSHKKAIELFISPIKESKKYLVLFQDCTEVRKMEKKAQEKERFASIGRMAAGIAHELRNPLSSIGGSIQLLDIHKKANTSENKRLMDLALREISRLNRIIGEFLDYASDEESSLSHFELESIDVNVILEELLDNVRVNPKWEHITHHFTLKSHGAIQGHSDKFKQVFLNIVKNACEAMEGQSTGQLEIESFDDYRWVVVRIKDTGVGISDRDKPHIYEPFYSSKDKGSGLGLAIVRKLVLFYKGQLSYDSHDKGGTVCTLRFPIVPNFCPGEMAQKKSA